MNEKLMQLTEKDAVIVVDPSLNENNTQTSKEVLVLSTKPFQAVPFSFDLNGESLDLND